MNRLIKEASYQISLQNIEYYSKYIHLGIEILLVISGEIGINGLIFQKLINCRLFLLERFYIEGAG